MTIRQWTEDDARASAILRIAREEQARADSVIREFDLEKYQATQIIRTLILKYGASRVAGWVTTKAEELGIEVGE